MKTKAKYVVFEQEKKSPENGSPRSRIPRLVLHPFRPKSKSSPLSDSQFSEEEGKECDLSSDHSKRTISTNSFCSGKIFRYSLNTRIQPRGGKKKKHLLLADRCETSVPSACRKKTRMFHGYGTKSVSLFKNCLSNHVRVHVSTPLWEWKPKMTPLITCLPHAACSRLLLSVCPFTIDDTGCPTSQSVSPSKTPPGSERSSHSSPVLPERKAKVKRVRVMAEWSAETRSTQRHKRELRSAMKARGKDKHTNEEKLSFS